MRGSTAAKKLTFAGLIGLIFIMGFGVFFIAQAILKPGAVENPTFGPSSDDVELNLSVSCTWVGWYCSVASCTGNVVGGEGYYFVPDIYCAGYVALPLPPKLGHVTEVIYRQQQIQ